MIFDTLYLVEWCQITSKVAPSGNSIEPMHGLINSMIFELANSPPWLQHTIP